MVLVGENPPSAAYVRSKVKATLEAGMESFEHRIPAETSQDDLIALVDRLNADDTPMTQAFRKGPLWASPDRVALRIARAIERRRSVVYAPGFWWAIMRVITHLPEMLFRRIKL